MIWARMKEIFKEEYNIEWKAPAECEPDVYFDWLWQIKTLSLQRFFISNLIILIMKLSLKNSSFFAAVAMSIWCLFIVLVQTKFYSDVILAIDEYFVLSYACSTLLLISMAILGISFYINRQQLPVLSKPLMWQTRVIVGLLFFSFLFS